MSTLNVSNISDGSTSVGTSYVVNGSAKAWTSGTYSSGTPSSNAALNVSSITDVSTGRLTVNITSGFSGVNYSVACSKRNATSNASSLAIIRTSGSAFDQLMFEFSGTLTDPTEFSAQAHGDLA